MPGGPPHLPRRPLAVEGTLTIDVYSDIHVGAKGFLERRFLRDLKETLDAPHRYLVLNGDLFNAAMRDAKHGGIHEETMTLDEAIDWWEAKLKDHPEKILGIVGGNHDKRAWDKVGIDPVRQLAARLKVADRYMQDGGFISTEHGKNKKTGRTLIYSGFYSHGTGSWPNSTNVQKITETYLADYYAMGHTHTPMTIAGVWYDCLPNSDTVVERPWIAGVGGSYLDHSGYALERRLRARPNGRLSFHLNGTERDIVAEIPRL
jgi:predicted phosphodiesterase